MTYILFAEIDTPPERRNYLRFLHFEGMKAMRRKDFEIFCKFLINSYLCRIPEAAVGLRLSSGVMGAYRLAEPVN